MFVILEKIVPGGGFQLATVHGFPDTATAEADAARRCATTALPRELYIAELRVVVKSEQIVKVERMP